MRALSVTTREPDAYRAGAELGAGLRDFQPEQVLLFSTIQYNGSPELLHGFFDSLEREVPLIGGTGDGFYASTGAADWGAVAIGLHGEGKLRWQVSKATGLAAKPENCTRSALQQAAAGLEPTLFLLFCDFRSDATRIERVIEREIKVPVVGGLAGDDNRIERCFQFCGREVLTDSAVALAIDGPLKYEIRIGNSIPAIGDTGQVDVASDTEIQRINGLSASDFIEQQTGKPILHSDRGVTTFTVIDADNPSVRRLRSIVQDRCERDGALRLYGGIEAGKRIQVCLARPSELVAEVQHLADELVDSGFTPAAAVIVSCAGRKWLLGADVEQEVQLLKARIDPNLPLAGFPSFGEIGPLKLDAGYSANLFHNMTYVLLMLGK